MLQLIYNSYEIKTNHYTYIQIKKTALISIAIKFEKLLYKRIHANAYKIRMKV